MGAREGLLAATGVLLIGFIMTLFWALALLVVAIQSPARAGDPEFWGNYPPDVHAWFPTVMQPGFEDMRDQGHSCCGKADAFEARIVGEDPIVGDILVIIDDGKGLIDDGKQVSVPKSKLQWKYGNPIGKVVLFMSSSGIVFCLIPMVQG